MQKILTTKNLKLRPFSLDDVNEVVKLAGEKEIAKTTLHVPYPYKKKDAINWIQSHKKGYEEGTLLSYAITSKNNKLIGCISLNINKNHNNAELAYWIGREYWNNGYCTEAARKILEFAFNELKLNKIYASYLDNNPASGKVMEKIGMEREGSFKKHIKKWEEFHDLICYGLVNPNQQ